MTSKSGKQDWKKGRKGRGIRSMSQMNEDAAGIDVGSTEHWAAVPPDRDEQPTRRFGAFTSDLYALAAWLKQGGIKTVAMESTGVYWVQLYQILEEKGFEVLLVDAKAVKHVSGRKDDMRDCEWIQQLHSFGLLSGAFRPTAAICELRAYLRHREMLIKCTAMHTQHMQKALTQMNLKLQHVISDITGVTGMKIVQAIVDGEREPRKLAEMKEPGIKNSPEVIAKALEGDYRREHLFTLKQALELYKTYREKIVACDEQIESRLQEFETKVEVDQAAGAGVGKKRRRRSGVKGQKVMWRNEPTFNCEAELLRMSGVDLTRIDGISASTALTILSEIGFDMGKWKTEKYFSSWLGLSPEKRITGGRVLSSKTRKVINRVATALRISAQSLLHSKSALGAYCRRMKQRLGTPAALTAVAHKLARLVYRMLKFGGEYVDIGENYYEEKYKQRIVKSLSKRAQQLGFSLVPQAPADLVVP